MSGISEKKEGGLEQHQVQMPVRHSREGFEEAAGDRGKVWAGGINMGIVSRT